MTNPKYKAAIVKGLASTLHQISKVLAKWQVLIDVTQCVGGDVGVIQSRLESIQAEIDSLMEEIKETL